MQSVLDLSISCISFCTENMRIVIVYVNTYCNNLRELFVQKLRHLAEACALDFIVRLLKGKQWRPF